MLGPFQGRAACIRIPFGKGVCGAAAASLEPQLVDDVEAFPGHIACDSASRSELVVPLVHEGELLGVIDLDSPRAGAGSTATTWPAVSNWHACSRRAWPPVAKPPPKR